MKRWSGYGRKRRCTYCGAPPTREGHDPCIANMPGVRFACCGHGTLEESTSSCYLVFDDGITVYGLAALEVMEMLGGQPPPIPEGVKVLRLGSYVEDQDELHGDDKLRQNFRVPDPYYAD